MSPYVGVLTKGAHAVAPDFEPDQSMVEAYKLDRSASTVATDLRRADSARRAFETVWI